MKKAYFLYSYFRIDKTTANRLREEMIKLAESDNHMEFWFLGCHDAFLKKALQFIGELRKVLPGNRLDIVLVEDPIKLERFNESAMQVSGIPKEMVSRIEMAPRIEGGVELRENRYIEHYRKVERWVMDQCDIVYAYHYDNIPHPVNNELKRLKKKDKPQVISVYNPEVRNIIDGYIDKMEDRGGYVLQCLKAGKTYREIGEDLEISANRVQQIANRATRNVMNYIAGDFAF